MDKENTRLYHYNVIYNNGVNNRSIPHYGNMQINITHNNSLLSRCPGSGSSPFHSNNDNVIYIPVGYYIILVIRKAHILELQENCSYHFNL